MQPQKYFGPIVAGFPTLSTSLKTLKKLSPANFFKSSMVHMPLASKVENNSGY